jgi:CRP-like cAMP-binding protein
VADPISLSALRRVSLLSQFSDAELQSVALRLRRRRYARGQVIFLQGARGTTFYVLVAGRVKIALISPEGKEIILRILEAGDFFGELALLGDQPRSAHAIALDACEALLLEREEFLGFLRDHPAANAKLLAYLCQRLEDNARRIEGAIFLDVAGRLAQTVLELAEQSGGVAPMGEPTTPELTQTELAELIGTTRRSVNKWLNRYERQGLIRKERRRIRVLRPDGLRRRITA